MDGEVLLIEYYDEGSEDWHTVARVFDDTAAKAFAQTLDSMCDNLVRLVEYKHEQ